jgi:hypothetical protein
MPFLDRPRQALTAFRGRPQAARRALDRLVFEQPAAEERRGDAAAQKRFEAVFAGFLRTLRARLETDFEAALGEAARALDESREPMLARRFAYQIFEAPLRLTLGASDPAERLRRLGALASASADDFWRAARRAIEAARLYHPTDEAGTGALCESLLAQFGGVPQAAAPLTAAIAHALAAHGAAGSFGEDGGFHWGVSACALALRQGFSLPLAAAEQWPADVVAGAWAVFSARAWRAGDDALAWREAALARVIEREEDPGSLALRALWLSLDREALARLEAKRPGLGLRAIAAFGSGLQNRAQSSILAHALASARGVWARERFAAQGFPVDDRGALGETLAERSLEAALALRACEASLRADEMSAALLAAWRPGARSPLRRAVARL